MVYLKIYGGDWDKEVCGGERKEEQCVHCEERQN